MSVLCSVNGYAYFMCQCLKTAIWLFWDKVWFLLKTSWQPFLQVVSGLLFAAGDVLRAAV